MKKQNFILILIFIFSIFNNNFAQITISGTISDPNANLVSGALVEIYDNNDTLNTYSATTNASGFFQISNITNIKNIEKTKPSDYLILRNYPNPFNPSTIIYFELPYSENIDIKIFDILGREVRTLFSGFHYAGVDQISWDGRNNFNQTVSAGVYLCQLKTKNNFTVHKMVLLDGGTNSSSNFSHKKISNHNPQMPVNVNSRFNFTVKVTGDSLDATYFRNLVCTKDTTLNLIVSKIIKTETIGIAGGTVGNDDFKISIPAGTFDGNYNISLIKIEEDGAFGENTVTPSFKVSGVPNNYSKPIKIIAKYSGELSGNSFLGIGISAFELIEESTSIVFNMYEAYDSLEYLVGYIPALVSTNFLSKKNIGTNLDFNTVFSTAYAITNSDHFKFVFPISAIQQISDLKEMFEDAYSVVEDGLQILIDDQIDRLVVVKSLEKPVTTNTTSNTVNGEEQLINIFNINQNSLFNDDYYTIQVKTTQELFSFTGMPEAVYIDNEKKLFEGKSWIEFAIYCWIEDLVSGDPTYKFPKNFLLEGMESFYGFNEDLGEDENPIPHGRGMSALIKYLTNKNSLGIGFVGYYKKNVKSYYTMVQDFVVSIGLPANEWWPDYLKELVNNELYTLPNDYFITRAIAEWNINTAADTLKEFTSIDLGKYQDLSAKTFTVNFNYTDLDETQNLKFKMTGPDNNKDLSLILFGIKNNKLEFIEKTQAGEYELENPKSYLTNGTTGFLVVPVNSNITQADYLGESEIDLEIRITPKIELPTCTFDITQYNQCSVGLAVNAKVRTDYENGDTKNEDRYFFQGSGNIDGSFVGNQFIGFIETDFGYDTLKVSLSQNLKFVESVSWTKYEENTEWRIFFLKGIEASAIPINCDFPNKFEITGDEACSYIDEIYYSYWTDLYIETISDWTCSETSNITITFSKK